MSEQLTDTEYRAMIWGHADPRISACDWHRTGTCSCPVGDVVERLSHARMLSTDPAHRPWTTTSSDIARLFHETYERLAPQMGYRTRDESAVPWDRVPQANRDLMVATVAEVRTKLLNEASAARGSADAS